MKYLIALPAVLFVVFALPADYDNEAFHNEAFNIADEAVDLDTEAPAEIRFKVVDIGSSDAALNSTFSASDRNTGLAGFGSGTRGGAGGAVWTVWDAFALRDAVSGNAARHIWVRGRIDLTVLFTASPGVELRVGNFKTIIGGDGRAEITGGGLRVSRSQHVIIQNLRIYNALNYAQGERPNGNGGIISQVPGAFSTIDAIGLDDCSYVWIDHVELADDPWNSNNIPENRRRHDGLLDITRGANLITVSNTIFRNHNLVGLVGNSDNNAAQDGPRLRITYYLNWFRGVTQRCPRVRYGRVHLMNNLYTDVRDYAVGIGTAASVYLERNTFINTRRAWGLMGTPNPMGRLDILNNILQNSRHDTNVPGNIGWRPNQHYGYNAMRTDNVEAHVRRYAGPW